VRRIHGASQRVLASADRTTTARRHAISPASRVSAAASPPRRRNRCAVSATGPVSCGARVEFGEQPRESRRPEELAQPLAVGFAAREIGECERQRGIVRSAALFESRAASACSWSAVRVRAAAISPVCASRFSSVPYSVISFAAPFSPIPFTPGMLSEGSPTRARRSSTRAGGTPKRSSTSAGP
jgi:hypothetical protein